MEANQPSDGKRKGLLWRILRFPGTLLYWIFGKPSWEAPPWLRWLWKGLRWPFRYLARLRERHPQAFRKASLAAVIAALLGGGLYAWYATRPRPVMFSVTGSTPAATPLKKDAKIDPLHVYFGGSAARLEDVGKIVTKGIAIDPPFLGAWKWISDKELLFEPSQDWPVNQKFTVQLDRALFPTHVLLKSYRYQFRSALFETRIVEYTFYQDPTDPNVKKVVVTFSPNSDPNRG